ncbi:MAG: potassium channel family protein [Saccharofermentanales bacterium]
MHVIVIGSGKVGSSLARELVNSGNDVVIIESDKKLLQNSDDIDCIKINGVPIDKDVLKSAGIDQADAVCAVTQFDNMNIMTSQVAKEIFNVKKVITRIFNPQGKVLFEEFGLDTICSTTLTVNSFIRALEDEKEEEVHRIFGAELVYSTMDIEKNQIGMQIHELSETIGRHIAGVLRNGKMIITLPDFKIEKDDKVVFLKEQY